jgi:hypothetical protein
MGTSSWDPTAWSSYAARTATRSTKAIFARRTIDPALDPARIKLREARDSVAHPNSTPIIVGLDVSGSMGVLAENLVRKGLGVLFQGILDNKVIADPHLMAMAIGDAACDQAPLQVTQFETDIVITQQVEKIFVEGGGGGNNHESYQLPWYFAATRTSLDSFEKRGKKGFLFTVGDEMPPTGLPAAHIRQVLGADAHQDLALREVLTMAERMYHVFHVVVEEGNFARGNPDAVVDAWRDVLGQRVIRLADYTKLAEVIISAIEVTEGVDAKIVAGKWTGNTAMVIARAVAGLPAATGKAGAVTRF